MQYSTDHTPGVKPCRREKHRPNVSHQSAKLAPQMTQQYFKTRLCPFLIKGNCRKGRSCTYAHSEDEIRRPPDLAKTKLCENWRKGVCKDPTCVYAHGREELRHTFSFYKTRLCHFWKTAGACNKGSLCRHAHGVEELRASEDDFISGEDNEDDYIEYDDTVDLEQQQHTGNLIRGSGGISSSFAARFSPWPQHPFIPNDPNKAYDSPFPHSESSPNSATSPSPNNFFTPSLCQGRMSDNSTTSNGVIEAHPQAFIFPVGPQSDEQSFQNRNPYSFHAPILSNYSSAVSSVQDLTAAAYDDHRSNGAGLYSNYVTHSSANAIPSSYTGGFAVAPTVASKGHQQMFPISYPTPHGGFKPVFKDQNGNVHHGDSFEQSSILRPGVTTLEGHSSYQQSVQIMPPGGTSVTVLPTDASQSLHGGEERGMGFQVLPVVTSSFQLGQEVGVSYDASPYAMTEDHNQNSKFLWNGAVTAASPAHPQSQLFNQSPSPPIGTAVSTTAASSVTQECALPLTLGVATGATETSPVSGNTMVASSSPESKDTLFAFSAANAASASTDAGNSAGANDECDAAGVAGVGSASTEREKPREISAKAETTERLYSEVMLKIDSLKLGHMVRAAKSVPHNLSDMVAKQRNTLREVNRDNWSIWDDVAPTRLSSWISNVGMSQQENASKMSKMSQSRSLHVLSSLLRPCELEALSDSGNFGNDFCLDGLKNTDEGPFDCVLENDTSQSGAATSGEGVEEQHAARQKADNTIHPFSSPDDISGHLTSPFSVSFRREDETINTSEVDSSSIPTNTYPFSEANGATESVLLVPRKLDPQGLSLPLTASSPLSPQPNESNAAAVAFTSSGDSTDCGRVDPPATSSSQESIHLNPKVMNKTWKFVESGSSIIDKKLSELSQMEKAYLLALHEALQQEGMSSGRDTSCVLGGFNEPKPFNQTTTPLRSSIQPPIGKSFPKSAFAKFSNSSDLRSMTAKGARDEDNRGYLDTEHTGSLGEVLLAEHYRKYNEGNFLNSEKRELLHPQSRSTNQRLKGFTGGYLLPSVSVPNFASAIPMDHRPSDGSDVYSLGGIAAGNRSTSDHLDSVSSVHCSAEPDLSWVVKKLDRDFSGNEGRKVATSNEIGNILVDLLDRFSRTSGGSPVPIQKQQLVVQQPLSSKNDLPPSINTQTSGLTSEMAFGSPTPNCDCSNFPSEDLISHFAMNGTGQNEALRQCASMPNFSILAGAFNGLSNMASPSLKSSNAGRSPHVSPMEWVQEEVEAPF